MAIQINKNTLYNNSIKLDTSYIRICIELSLDGLSMNIKCSFYQNKESYKTTKYSMLIHPYINSINDVKYDYTIDGDPIIYAHSKIMEYLTTDKILEQDVVVTDASGNTIDLSKSIIETNDNGSMITINNNMIFANYNKKTTIIFKDKRNGIITLSTVIDDKCYDPSDVSIVDLD